MKTDVLLQSIGVIENGTNRKSCPGLVIVTWSPPGEIQIMNPQGRKVSLKDNTPIAFSGYQDQLEMRVTMTGKSWIDVQVISMTDFGLMGTLITELLGLAKKSFPLPIGASAFDNISDNVKKGCPQIIAQGRSDMILPDSIPATITIQLTAPNNVLGDNGPQQDPVTGLPTDGPIERPILKKKGEQNGSATIRLEKA